MNYEDFKHIKVKHITSLFTGLDKANSFKNISINCIYEEISLAGDILQFGVFKGHTARILESFILPDRKLHLFDSFEGLPDNWSNTDYEKGHFAIDEEEQYRFDPQRTIVHKGWFDDTIGPYKEKYGKPIAMIHLDADLYSSTTTVLEKLNDLIIPGTILLFDEFFLPNDVGVSDDEARAYHDWLKKFDRECQILWRTRWVQCAIMVLK